MARPSISELNRYLFKGLLSRRGCQRLRCPTRPLPSTCHPFARCQHKWQHNLAPRPPQPDQAGIEPLRKQLKDKARAAREARTTAPKRQTAQLVDGWELTVGIEIHAQLNTAHKLFSSAPSPAAAVNNWDAPAPAPNSHVAPFDLAVPGSQPVFQRATLVPAVRAALALGCDIQPVSRFDRKHYFHWDQPAGYQLTQYYAPFARDGRVALRRRDGIPPAGGDAGAVEVVRIRQVQLEQDTAKTTAQPGATHWLDFNRVGLPLVEIISQPDLHTPAAAAAFVRKVQAVLAAADACVSGMEAGGLRADVNVSVRPAGAPPRGPLGTRVEIKNLSSLRAVEEAVIAERDRQIALLKAGGVVLGETRGWTLGGSETRRLRGKEGEVDYRYMPDPDLGPLVIGRDLVEYLAETMGSSVDEQFCSLVGSYGLSEKDASALMALNGGGRAEYFYKVVQGLQQRFVDDGVVNTTLAGGDQKKASSEGVSRLAANWVLHEFGRLKPEDNDGQGLDMTEEGDCVIPVEDLVNILFYVHRGDITGKSAKELLFAVFRGEIGCKTDESIEECIGKSGLWHVAMAEDEHKALADVAIEGEEKVLQQFAGFGIEDQGQKKYPKGKLQYLVGKMMRMSEKQSVDPVMARRVMAEAIHGKHLPALVSTGSEKAPSV